MNLTLSTYNGSTITAYRARIPGDNIGLEANLISAARASNMTAYGGKSFKPATFEILFTVATSGAQRQTDIENIGKLFNPRDTTLHALVATDANDSNAAYQVQCTVQHAIVLSGGVATVQMWSPDPVWEEVTASTQNISVTSGSGNATCTVAGNVDTYPTITVTPTSGIGSYRYRRHVIVYNALAEPLPNYPLDITSGGFDTATAVTAGYMLANGDDLHVTTHGAEIERWLGGMNSANTKVWVVLDFAAKAEGVLQTALGASNNTSIVFTNTLANKDALHRMPNKGLVLIDSECIAYTAKNEITRTLTISNSGRGYKDTTAAAHSAAATIRWIQYDLVISYANPSDVALSQTNEEQPCFSLANSTNANWRYDSADSVFWERDGRRSGAWRPTVARGTYSDYYTGNQGTIGTNPATNMGCNIVSYQAGALYKAEAATIRWTLHSPASFTNVNMIGEKWRTLTTTPWPLTRLLSSADGAHWTQEWAITGGSVAATWATFSQQSTVPVSGANYLRFEMTGAVNAKADAEAMAEVGLGSSGSTGVSMGTATVPQVTLKAQASNTYVNFTLTNTTTGEAIYHKYPAAANDVITIDTENRTVTMRDALLTPVDLNTIRPEWLRLQPGANALTYADGGGGAATVVVSWNERKSA